MTLYKFNVKKTYVRIKTIFFITDITYNNKTKYNF